MGPTGTPTANGHITIINSNPTNLTATRCLASINRTIAIFREDSHPNNLLVCNVPGVGLSGSVVREELSVLRRTNIAFIYGARVNGSVTTRRLISACSTIILYNNTAHTHNVGIRNGSTGNMRVTVSFLATGARGVLTNRPRRDGVATGSGRIVIVNNKSAKASYINASVHRNTGDIRRFRVVPRTPSGHSTGAGP